LNGGALKIWRAHPVGPAAGRRGTVVSAAADGIVVAADDGGVCITELQKAGGKRLSAAVFLSGSALAPGTRFGA
jgi:methionyl-tRNA formyltransferase